MADPKCVHYSEVPLQHNTDTVLMLDVKTLGLLSSPSDLMVIYNASSVTISWAAPFSLDVTGVDPDIWYSVLIYNVTDENNPTAILCTDCINITETHYTFTPDYLSPCHVYNFSVIPVNGAGQGESSSNVTCAKYSRSYILVCVMSVNNFSINSQILQ